MKGYFESEVLGACVEKNIADKFRENLKDISTTDAIEWFIYQIATGQMHIVREESDEE